jgi:hypothetical protein
MRPAREVKKERVNLDIHPEVKELIKDVQARICADSMGEVIRRAVFVYGALLSAQSEGDEILLKKKCSSEAPRQLMLF